MGSPWLAILASVPPPGRIREALALWQLFVLVMVFFLIVLGLMIFRRWITRRSEKPREENHQLPDPWKESAERIEPEDQ